MANYLAQFTTATVPHARRILLGLFLIAAFAATSAVLLFVITAERLQDSLNAPQFTSLSISTGWIRRDVSDVAHYWKIAQEIAKRQDAAQERLFQANARAENARATIVSIADEIRNFIALNDTNDIRPPLKPHPFIEQVAAPQAAPAVAPAATPEAAPVATPVAPTAATPAAAPAAAPPDLGKDVDDYFDAYYSELGNAPGADAARKSLDEFKTAIYKRLARYFAARAQYDDSVGQAQASKAEIAELRAQLKQLDEDVVKESPTLANGPYWSLCEDFLAFKTLVGERAYDIVALPKMMLVLILSIFMGILGSLIYIAQDFMKNPDGRGFWDVLFRIGLGAGVAFALFFFAAAGMLALSQGPSGGAQADMSPYLISFLGITGGYLSDRVTEWMREVGENTFKISAGGPPPRWAIGLDTALKSASLSSAQLASATGVTVADAESWVSLAKAVPGDKQALVSAFLRIHPSKIFTDIAPG
jgi:hypothetical protein